MLEGYWVSAHQRRLTSGRTEVFAGSREAAGAVNVNRRHAELIPPARSDVGQQDALFGYLRVTEVRGQGACTFSAGNLIYFNTWKRLLKDQELWHISASFFVFHSHHIQKNTSHTKLDKRTSVCVPSCDRFCWNTSIHREAVLCFQCLWVLQSRDLTSVHSDWPVPCPATGWRHLHWGECQSSSGAEERTEPVLRRCWSEMTSVSPADRRNLPQTPTLSWASEELLRQRDNINMDLIKWVVLDDSYVSVSIKCCVIIKSMCSSNTNRPHAADFHLTFKAFIHIHSYARN